ncbi:hypothetical protein [Gordonia alkaliphila]|uniref:Uncharacterized protein n=1 Tax=Gordonia alkaliphila TaxID=1053547 RepID=A0ABP8YWU1_9ACTN
MTELSHESEARLADRQADRLEAQAADREDRSARWYGGGSHAYVLSMDTAARYRAEARALRSRAAYHREQAARGTKG